MVLSGVASIVGGVVRIGQQVADEFLRVRERRAQLELRKLEQSHELALLRYEARYAQRLDQIRGETEVKITELRTDSQLARALSTTMDRAYAHDTALLATAHPAIKSIAACVRPALLLFLVVATVVLALGERSGAVVMSISAMTEAAVAYYFVDRSLYKRQASQTAPL